MSERVLLVAHAEQSRSAALAVSEELSRGGYAVDFSNSGDNTEIKADRIFDPESSPSGYEGIVFFDDGGNIEAAVSLASRTLKSKNEVVLGGYGPGCLILGRAKALKGQYVPGELAKEFKGKPVDAPSARSGNIVTCTGGCPSGFAALLIDALGGEIKKIVTADDTIIEKSALIITKEPWPVYWNIARSLKGTGRGLVLASYGDLNLVSGTFSKGFLLDGIDVKTISGKIPKNFWLQQEDVSINDIKILEAAGRQGTNPSSAIEDSLNTISISKKLAETYEQPKFSSAMEANSEDLMHSSHDVFSKEGRRIGRVNGYGEYAVISINDQKSIGMEEDVKQVLSSDRLIAKAGRVASISGEDIEFGCLIVKSSNGWQTMAEAAFRKGVGYHSLSACEAIFGSNEKMPEIRAIAENAAAIVEQIVPTIRELGIYVSAGENGPQIRVEPRPLYHKFSMKESILPISDPPESEDQPPKAADMSSMIVGRADAKMHKVLIEREMAREGMYVQPDGTLSVETVEGTYRSSTRDVFEVLRKQAITMFTREERCMKSGCPYNELRRAKIGSLRARHRFKLLLAYIESVETQEVKVAGLYGTSIAGPYANLDLPWSERIMEWKEGDDWLSDRDKAITSLPRYNPEYERTTPNDEFGIYYRWEEPQRTPYEWSRRFIDGTYPMRKVLHDDPKSTEMKGKR